MAWLDDKAWCHPKLVGLSDRAHRVFLNSISYSSGMKTQGRLTPNCQRLLGASKKVTEELVAAGLWDVGVEKCLHIHDWDVHNGQLDARRKKDRERKKAERLSVGQSEGKADRVRRMSARLSTPLSEDTLPPLPAPLSPPSPLPPDPLPLTPLYPPNPSPPSQNAAKSPRPRNFAWDAVTAVFGPVTNDRERGKRAKSVQMLKQSLDASEIPEDEYEWAMRWRKKALEDSWGIPCTELALASNWSQAVAVSEFVPAPPKKTGAMTLTSDWDTAAAAVIAKRGLELNGNHDLELEASDG